MAENMHNIWATFTYLFTTFLICRLLRSATKAFIPTGIQHFVLDIICTFQLCACAWENGFVLLNFGVIPLMIQLFFLATWYKYTFENNSPNPLGVCSSYFLRRTDFKTTLIKVVLQMTAGLSSVFYAKLFWSLGLSTAYTERLNGINTGEVCGADLTVPVVYGMAVESGGMLAITLLSGYCITGKEVYDKPLLSFYGVWITMAGLYQTGMYLNPANASSQNLGCHGNTFLEHVMVYWVSPLLTSYLIAKVSKREFRRHASKRRMKRVINKLKISSAKNNENTGENETVKHNGVFENNGYLHKVTNTSPYNLRSRTRNVGHNVQNGASSTAR